LGKRVTLMGIDI